MTEAELVQIEQRVEAATAGPWEIEQSDPSSTRVLWARGVDRHEGCLMGDEQYYPSAPNRREDWTFIAHARADIPALVAEVRALRRALALVRRNPEMVGVVFAALEPEGR